MRILREIGMLSFRCIKATLRNPIFLVMGVVMPLTYLALFTPLLKTLVVNGTIPEKHILTFFVPGMLPIIAFSKGLFTGFTMISELRAGVIERLRVTPASRFSILSGHVLFDTLAALFQSLLFVLVAIPFGFRADFLGMITLFALLALLTIITSSVGNALGLKLKGEDRYAPLVHGINLPILLLSGTLLPFTLAPAWLKIVAHLNPVYYVVNASRALAVGNFSAPSILYAFAILTPMAFIALTLSTRTFKKTVT
ncbi:MAG: ABC transporter permease [Simkaniaceae bacterium]|nr:ABC transporter permease [Simkaniaceae bacterium]